MEIHGQIIYGLHFRLFKEDKDVILQLYAYFTGDINLCKHYGIDLRKGLFLSGKTGVGKTVHENSQTVYELQRKIQNEVLYTIGSRIYGPGLSDPD